MERKKDNVTDDYYIWFNYYNTENMLNVIGVFSYINGINDNNKKNILDIRLDIIKNAYICKGLHIIFNHMDFNKINEKEIKHIISDNILYNRNYHIVSHIKFEQEMIFKEYFKNVLSAQKIIKECIGI